MANEQDFDLDNYFAQRLGSAGVDKINRVRQASADKADGLAQFRANLAGQGAIQQANEAADAKSLVGRLGLDPNGAVGSTVNAVAEFGSGASRLVGNVAGLIPGLHALEVENTMSQEETDAYNRYQQLGSLAGPETMAILNRRKAVPSAVNAKAGMVATPEYAPTVLEQFKGAQKAREAANAINEFFDISSIVHQGERRKLTSALGEDFDTKWNKVTGGWDQAQKGAFIEGTGNIVSGFADLITQAGEAAYDNPRAVTGYIVENAPQLFVGALGKAGAATMTASNVGYAVDTYQKGIREYQKNHDQQLPSLEEQHRMAMYAASLALAEQVGDMVGLGAAKGATDAARTGFKASILNSIKAGGQGLLTEAATEGYQTFAEGEVNQKPATAQDIYTGAVIGGLSGAALAGGGRVVAEATKATPEQAAKREAEAKQAADFQQAVLNNDPAVYFDNKAETYDPAMGLGVLFAVNQKEDTTPEQKQASLQQAVKVVTDLESRYDELIEERKDADKARAAELSTEIATLQRQISESDKVFDQLVEQVNPTPSQAELKEVVQQAKDTDTEVAAPAAERVINLAMRNVDALSRQDADALAASETVSPEQRNYLQAFSAARVSDNQLSSMKQVSQEILYGSRKNVGIAQYRQRIGSAIAANNPAQATRQLGMLSSFAAGHASKAQAAAAAIKQGLGTQIVKTGNTWSVAPEKLSNKQLASYDDFMVLNSARLVKDIGTEAQALANAQIEMQNAVALRFPSAGVQSVSSAVPTTSKASTTPSPENKQQGQASKELTEKRVKDLPRPESKASEPVVEEASPTVKKDKLTAAQELEAKQKRLVEEAAARAAERKQTTQPIDAAPEVQASTAEESKPETGLSLYAQKTPAGEQKPYQSRNLVADYFIQKLGKEGGSTRPLIAVPGFLASLKDRAVEFIKGGKLTDQQNITLDHFVSMASQWDKTIAGNFILKGKPEYRYKDFTQFFLDDAGKADANVHTAIAYAAYSWVAENASRSRFNGPEEINAILGRDEDHVVTAMEEDALADAGTRENVVVNTLGQRVAQALGLAAQADAPLNLQGDLEIALGAHALKLLVDQGIAVRTEISGETMAQLTGSKKTNQNAEFRFIQVAYSNAGELNPTAAAIKEAAKGSQGVLDKLFGAEAGLKDPSFEKIPFTQQTARNTTQPIPSSERKVMAHENAQPNHLRQDMWHLLGQLHPDVVLEIAGFQSINEDTTHVVNRASIEAKNDGLRREYERAMAFFGVMQAQDELDKPLYFDHSVWKQQRVGVATNSVNPQASKLHRRLLYRPTWEVELQISDRDGMENFKLRVAEGLGIKTDKQDNEASLAQLTATVAKPEIKRAVAVLRKALTEGGLTEAEQQDLVTGVKAGGEDMHTLDALVAMAQYMNAVAAGQNTFTTYLSGEVDGVTNGPMLSHLMMGAAEEVDDLYDLLNRGGFYQKQEEGQTVNYNQWRAQSGHRDLYENTTAHVMDNIRKLQVPQATINALSTITGELLKPDGVTVAKAGRDIIKTPLTAVHFGSAVQSAQASMADNFIAAVYGRMEDVAAGKLELPVLLASLKQLGVDLGKPSIKQLMETPLKPGQVATLKQVFNDTIGKATEQTMQEDLEVFIARRRTFNQSAQLAFDLYHTAYTGLREAKRAELIKLGAIPVNGAGQPIHDLTRAQEEALRKEVQDILPIMGTAFSEQSGERLAGLLSAKSQRTLSQKPDYTGEIQFGTPFKDNGSKSLKTRAMERDDVAPGVAMLVMGMHATDSFISHTGVMQSEVLNIHDAHVAGLGNFKQAAQNLNQATWKAMLGYSLPSAMADTLATTIRGVAGLYEAGKLPSETQQALQQVLARWADTLKTSPGAVLDIQLQAMKDLALSADDMKLQALEQMAAIDQYALQGGSYLVTDTDRAQAKAARRQLSNELSIPEQEALAALSGLAKGVVKIAAEADPETDALIENQTAEELPTQMNLPGPYTSPWGELGAPGIESNAYLVGAFNDKPVMSAKEAVKVARTALVQQESNRNTAFMGRLLDLVEKTVPVTTSVNFITPATPASDVLAHGAEHSRGWFVAKGDRQAVYLLSPDFKYSGLTPETLVHELVHAALATTVESALEAKTGDAYALVQELESLRSLASSYVKDNKLTGYGPALENVHEFISWGMSNLDFQRNVLNKVSMKSSTTGNRLVTGMQRFIEALTGLLFKGSSKSAQEQMENGMAVLISNVSGLFMESQRTKSKADLVLNQKNTGAVPREFTTSEIFDALEDTRSPVSPGFQAQLKGLLSGIVDTLHGPYGTFKAALMQNQPTSPAEVYAQALVSGQAPFASQSLAAGFRISEQEAFVLEQVEVTVKAALTDKEGHTTMAYKELAKLYAEAAKRLKPSDFQKPGTTVQEAQALYDFVFKLEQNPDGSSDYLARFAALGLAHEQVADLLNFATEVKTETQLAGRTLTEKLHALYDRVLAFLSQTFTHTFEGQQADEKLEALVTQLVGIEAKKRMKLDQQKNRSLDGIEDTLKDLGDKGRDKVEAFLKSPFFKTNSNAFIKAAGTLGAAVAGDRVDLIMEGIMRMRDEHFRHRHGVVAGLINEIRGSRPDNVMFHKLLRVSKHIEGQRKDIITNTAKFTLESFANNGEDLTQEHKAAISAVFLRTDAASLMGHYGMQELGAFIRDPALLQKEIARLENQLSTFANFGHYFVKGAKLLGYYKASGRIAGANVMFNAGNIANLYGTPYAGRIAASMASKAEPVIDRLTSLYALSYVDPTHLKNAKEVLADENRRTDGGNGIEMVLKLHAQLQQQSKDRLFAAGEPLYMKGYVPELYNPYVTVLAANGATGEQLVKQGYAEGAEVHRDQIDPDREVKRLYVLRDGGLQSHLTGVFSYTGMRSKGSKVIDGAQNLVTAQGLANTNTMMELEQANATRVRDMFKADPGFDPRKVGDAFLAPVLNATGDVVNYRYMMAEHTKDTLLERNNAFEQLLGSLAGNIFDKEMTQEQNERAVQALKDQYDAEFAQRHHSYLRVGENSTDPELREIWRLLPEGTKQAVRDIWGGNNMMVRVDLLDINFGYRKLSIADAFDKDASERNAFERVVHEMGMFLFGDKARLRLKQGEDIWQALVREAKDTMVVKSGITLLGNITSNLTELAWFGVPAQDILRHHRVAMKGALAYRKDSEALDRINLQLSTGYLPAVNVKELERQKILLEDALARNPVKDLIDAGLMPTIVEDVAADDDQYSFKGRFTRKVEEFSNNLNPHIVDTAKTLLIAHDTPLYKALSYGTQLSDFVARYTLYQHMVNRKRNPMGREEAIQLVSDAFINYDVPSHRLVQYANDTGLIFFSKYYLRIQKVIMHLYRENPARALALLVGSHYFDAVPTLMDSAAVARLGNPFSTGALKYVTTLDELGTVNALMTPFK